MIAIINFVYLVIILKNSQYLYRCALLSIDHGLLTTDYIMFSDEYFMKMAIREAKVALEAGEIPVGAIIVSQNQILTRAHNQTELLKDVTAHAEMIAVTAAANNLNNKYLNDCTLYVTLEPCAMCAGALAWAQLGRLVYGASDEKRGFSRHQPNVLHPKTAIISGILETECSELLRSFFDRLRAKIN